MKKKNGFKMDLRHHFRIEARNVMFETNILLISVFVVHSDDF